MRKAYGKILCAFSHSLIAYFIKKWENNGKARACEGGFEMKLVYAIVHDEDSERATRKLNEKKFSVTKLSSTGGFLKRGNTTLMIGTEDEKVPEVIEIVKEECAKRQQIEVQAPYMGSGAPVSNYSFVPITVEAGGATIFVINVEEFHKV